MYQVAVITSGTTMRNWFYLDEKRADEQREWAMKTYGHQFEISVMKFQITLDTTHYQVARILSKCNNAVTDADYYPLPEEQTHG